MVLKAAMLVVRNNRSRLLKIRVLFPKDGNFIVLTTSMATVKTSVENCAEVRNILVYKW